MLFTRLLPRTAVKILAAAAVVLSPTIPLATVSAQVPQGVPPLPPGGLPPPPPLPPSIPPSLNNTAPQVRSGRGPDVKLQAANADIADILGIYEQFTGKRVIADPALQGKLTIYINQPLPREDAIKLIEAQLMLSGFSIVQGDGNVVKVVLPQKNARVLGPPIFSDASQLPEGEQVVSFLFRPRYLDAAKLQQALSLYIPIQNQYTSFVTFPDSNALLATENSHTIRRLIGLVEQLDVPPALVVDKFIKLQRADAAKAVEFINAVLERDKSGQAAAAAGGAGGSVTQRRPIRRFNEDGQPVPVEAPPQLAALPGGFSAAAAGAIAALSEGAVVQGKVTLTADVRTNRVHVVARPADLDFIEKLINQYDANTQFGQSIRRPLRYLTATDVLPILAQTLREPGQPNDRSGGGDGGDTGAGDTGGTGGTGGGARSNTGGSSLLGGSSGGLFGSGSSNSSGFGGSSSGGLGGSTGGVIGGPSLKTREVSDRARAVVVGTTRLIADPRANVIIVSGSAEAQDKVFRVLDQLDVPAPQVMIEVLIGELSLGNQKQFGLDYLLRSGRRGSDVLSTNATRLPPPVDVTSSGTTTTGGTTTGTSVAGSTLSSLAQLGLQGLAASSGFGGLAGVVTAGNRLALTIRALEETNRFKTISRPVIFTSNNKEATILSGQEIAIPTQTLQNAGTISGSAAIASSIQYKEVALQLDVVPLINSDNAVTLDIVQQVKSPVAGSSTNVGGTAVPTIATRVLKSTVTVPNQSTVVLGGLIQQSQESNQSKVPFLNRIPVLGPILFTSRSKNNTRGELIIMMKPTVTNTAAQLDRSRVREENKLYLEPGLSEQLDPIIPKATAVETKTTTTVTTAKRRPAPPLPVESK